MRTRCTGPYVVAALLVVARATQTIMVDDGDPGIEYHGTWVHNPVEDPKDLNYGGSVTFTNVSGSTATYKFAGIAIAVFGAFEEVGTFAMHSTYSIDGGAAADFIPASTIVRASYRQKFFQSSTLPDGEHILVITNAGKELWLDYLLVTQESPSTTIAPTTSASQKSQALPSSTAQVSPHTVVPATPSPGPTSAGRLETLQSSSGPSSQTQATTQSFTSTNNATLTVSTDAAASSPFSTSSTPQSQTSTFVLGTPSTIPSSAPEHAHPAKMAAGAIAGLAVAGLLVVVLIGLVGWRSRRRRKQTKHGDLAPYDPGLTALAFEPSEKHERAREEGTGSTGGSAASSLLSLSLPRAAQAHAQAPDLEEARAFWSSADRGVPHEVRTTDLSRMVAGDNRLTGFEPLGSPSSASPLLAHSRRTLRHKRSPITPTWGKSGSVSSAIDERRRSVDGGVRIAGGPPVGNLRREDGDADDVRSGLSTLPPSYQFYPVA